MCGSYDQSSGWCQKGVAPLCHSPERVGQSCSPCGSSLYFHTLTGILFGSVVFYIHLVHTHFMFFMIACPWYICGDMHDLCMSPKMYSIIQLLFISGQLYC